MQGSIIVLKWTLIGWLALFVKFVISKLLIHLAFALLRTVHTVPLPALNRFSHFIQISIHYMWPVEFLLSVTHNLCTDLILLLRTVRENLRLSLSPCRYSIYATLLSNIIPLNHTWNSDNETLEHFRRSMVENSTVLMIHARCAMSGTSSIERIMVDVNDFYITLELLIISVIGVSRGKVRKTLGFKPHKWLISKVWKHVREYLR